MKIRSRPPVKPSHTEFVIDGQISPCQYCSQPVRWMATLYAGAALCFDSDPVDRALDRFDEGWLPGKFAVRGKYQIVLAPLRRYVGYKKMRASHVMQLHNCPNQHRAEAIG